MEFRKTDIFEAYEIIDIIIQAKKYFKIKGIDQWQNNYPDEGLINDDIVKENSFVLLSNNKIIATASISFTEEYSYRKIYKGRWLSEFDYAVIHRIAVSNENKRQGAATYIFKEVEKMCREKGINSIRIDTHQDNIPMQKLIEKNGFQYCGIIFLEDGSKRLAYEKLMNY